MCNPNDLQTQPQPTAPTTLHVSSPPSQRLPPSTSLPLLAKAHILLCTQADLNTETEFGAIAACGIMLYGIIRWRQAEYRERLRLLNQEEEREEWEKGEGEEGRWRVEMVDRELRAEEREGNEVAGGKEVEEEVARLVDLAVGEIRDWDREVGRRLEFALREVIWAKWCVEGKGIRMPS